MFLSPSTEKAVKEDVEQIMFECEVRDIINGRCMIKYSNTADKIFNIAKKHNLVVDDKDYGWILNHRKQIFLWDPYMFLVELYPNLIESDPDLI